MTTFFAISLLFAGCIGARAFTENVRCLRKTRNGRTANSPSRSAPFFMDSVVWPFPKPAAVPLEQSPNER